jgi:FSR family fosmidomycin resistance protein-like MFS transporter
MRPARAGRRPSQPVATPALLFGLRWRLWLMTFGHLVIDSNAALLFALLPLFVMHLHINLAQAGALATLLLMTSSLVQPLFGFVHDRYPLFPMAAAGLLLAGVGMGLTGFVTTYTQMVVLVLISGFGIAAFHPQAVAQAARASAGSHEWGIAMFFTGASMGTGIMSLLIVPLSYRFGPHATLVTVIPAVVAAALFLRAYPSWMRPVPRTPGGATATASMRAVAVPLSMLLIVSILRSAVLTAYLTFLPTLVVFRTGSLGLGALALAAFLFSGSLGAIVGGAVAHRIGSSPVVLVSLVAGLLGLLPVPWLPTPILVPWMVGAGVLMFASEAQVTALAQRLLPAFVGTASSLIMGVGLGLGNAGALVTGAVADRRGIQVAMTATTLLMIGAIAAAGVYVLSMRVQPSTEPLDA